MALSVRKDEEIGREGGREGDVKKERSKNGMKEGSI